MKMFFHINAFLKKIILFFIFNGRFKVGKYTTWRRRFNIMISKNAKIVIGKSCFFNNDCSINAENEIIIGDNSIFGENVKIYDHNHKFRNCNLSIKEQGYKKRNVYIGNNCWIGSNVTILSGTEIADRCVIGANCVINGKIGYGTLVKMSNNLKCEKINFNEGI